MGYGSQLAINQSIHNQREVIPYPSRRHFACCAGTPTRPRRSRTWNWSGKQEKRYQVNSSYPSLSNTLRLMSHQFRWAKLVIKPLLSTLFEFRLQYSYSTLHSTVTSCTHCMVSSGRARNTGKHDCERERRRRKKPVRCSGNASMSWMRDMRIIIDLILSTGAVLELISGDSICNIGETPTIFMVIFTRCPAWGEEIRLGVTLETSNTSPLIDTSQLVISAKPQ